MTKLILANYLITFYFTDDGISGPFGVFEYTRNLFGGESKIHDFLYSIFNCPYCFSFWASLVLCAFSKYSLIDVFAVAGGTCLIFKTLETIGNLNSIFAAMFGVDQ